MRMFLLSGVRPFPCPHCDKIFRTSGHRKTHIASHFKSLQQKKHKFPRKIHRTKVSKSNLPLPDIPLQEPILITDLGNACILARSLTFTHAHTYTRTLFILSPPPQVSSSPRTLAWSFRHTWRWWTMIGHTSVPAVTRPIRNPATSSSTLGTAIRYTCHTLPQAFRYTCNNIC